MVDIVVYRSRIGQFHQNSEKNGHRRKIRKFATNYHTPAEKSRIRYNFNILILVCLLPGLYIWFSPPHQHQVQVYSSPTLAGAPDDQPIQIVLLFGKRISPNFKARYKYGNIKDQKRGIKNMHLNIRSLRNKVFEVKNIVKEYLREKCE